jgi:hypothetical protein
MFMTAVIDTATRSSLGKLLRLLASDVDGEVLGAVRALRRVLATNKLDLHDLANIIESPSIAPSSGNGRAYARHWHDDIVETEIPWRDMVAACMRHIGRFSSKEREFVRNMNGWCGEPSAKQVQWLLALFERVRGMP